MRKRFLIGVLVAVLPLPILAQVITNGPDVDCMQEAIERRDEDMIDAFDEYNDAITEALDHRKENEVDAWDYDNPGLRQQAIQIARVEFDRKYALFSHQFNVTRQAVNDMFRVEQQICVIRGSSSSSRSSRR